MKEKKGEMSISLSRKSNHRDLISLLDTVYETVQADQIDVSDWTDVIEFAEAFEQFQRLWAEWYEGNSSDFDIVHQVFLNILFSEKNLEFQAWKTERLDAIREYISASYPDWVERLACSKQSDKEFAFLCLLSAENSMWYQYLSKYYPGLCELYKTEEERLIQYEHLVYYRKALRCELLPEVSDVELIEHYCAKWIEAEFKNVSSSYQQRLSVVVSDSIIVSLRDEIEKLRSQLKDLQE